MSITRASDDEIEKIYEKIEEHINLTNDKENLIIMEDWNAIVGEHGGGKEVCKWELGIRNEKGDRLVEFC